ncbi:EamA family transporter [Candidatus Bathyarchaeota archaeon]|nr:EamA family transporter [Candidatus Bathyarchaeota archaeon]
MELFMLYAITASLFFSIFTFIAKYVISRKMSSFISFVYMQGILIVVLFPVMTYLLVPSEIFLPPAEVIPYAYVSGVTSIIAYLLMYYGLSRYDASLAVPVLGVKPVFVIPLSFFLLNEFYGYDTVLWILVAMVGAIMTTWDETVGIRRLFSLKNKALLIFSASALLYAAGNIAVKPAMRLVSSFNFLIWRELGWFGTLLVLSPVLFREGDWECLKGEWRRALVVVLLAIIAQYFAYVLMFYSLGFSVQISEGLSGSQGIFAAAMGFLLSKTRSLMALERHGNRIYLVRMLGALMIMFGIYNLSYSFDQTVS